MANKPIDELPAAPIPLPGGAVGVIDDGVTTYKHDLRYWGLSSATITYNPDGTVATITKAGRTTTFTYTDGFLTSCTDGVVSKTFGYTGGQLTSVTIS
jgi:YD repeat-containing protein